MMTTMISIPGGHILFPPTPFFLTISTTLKPTDENVTGIHGENARTTTNAARYATNGITDPSSTACYSVAGIQATWIGGTHEQ